MTVFRNNSEPDPTPGTTAQIEQQAATLAGKQTAQKATAFTGQDVGLSQSLADLKKGYADAARIQSEQSQAAAIQRASVDSQIAANTPTMGVEFVGHKAEQYQVGDSSTVPTSDPLWRMPVEHLRTNLELLQDTYRAVERVSQTRSPKDFQIAAELGERLQQSMGRDFPPEESGVQPQPQPAQEAQPPSPRPETFENGEVYKLEKLPDGNLEVQLITGERFVGDPITVTQKIAQAKVSTTNWGREWKQRAEAYEQQLQNGNRSTQPLIPASQTQYDEYDAPILDSNQISIPDQTLAQMTTIAQALGYNDANELVTDQLALRAKTDRIEQELAAEREERQNHETASEFLARNQDFPNSDASIAILDQLIANNNLDWTEPNMSMAHSFAVAHGLYKPLTQGEIEAAAGVTVQSRRPVPPPMIPGGNPESNFRTEDVHNMPLEQLRRLAIQQELEGKGSSLSYR